MVLTHPARIFFWADEGQLRYFGKSVLSLCLSTINSFMTITSLLSSLPRKPRLVSVT